RAARPRRRGRRGGLCHPVPRLRRMLLRHRRGAGGRWLLNRRLKDRQRSDKLALFAPAPAAHSPPMGRNRSESGWRASAVAVALFAITLNFLQPLAHAALMRDGAPSVLWGTFCSAAAADPGADGKSTPVPVDTHECCLGLAHAVAFTAP